MGIVSTNQAKPTRLDALTSLRFFAASLIVFHHSVAYFGFGAWVNRYFPTYQAVSFFFVLSGFILTYVYRQFDSPQAIRRFLIARIARVWPLHLATLLIILIALHGEFRYRASLPDAGSQFWCPLATNFFLAQSWIPFQGFYWGFNAVSWSISTEFGFYLLFPVLVYGLNRNWPLKWVAAFGFTLLVVLVLSMVSTRWVSVDYMTIFGIVCANPLVRVFEFTSGMVMAVFFGKLNQSYNPGKPVATIVEIVSLAALLVGMSLNFPVQMFVNAYLGGAGKIWVDVGNANVITVAPFILIMALAKGKLSRGLSRKGLVFLGEISFSVYLIHQILLRIYGSYIKAYDVLPLWISYSYFWIVILLVSYLLWEIVEKPCRKMIINLGKGLGFLGMGQEVHSVARKKSIWATVLVFCILMSPLYGLKQDDLKISVIDEAKAESLSGNSVYGLSDIRFGSQLMLKSIILDDSLTHSMKLVWSSLGRVTLQYRVAVHFLDRDGKILSQADYDQSHSPNRKGKVGKNTFWVDDIDLSLIPDTVHAIGLALFTERDMKLLPISDGPRDWNNTRLIIPRFR
ncbi:MAG: acyltransferase [Pseudomonadota bacterium]